MIFLKFMVLFIYMNDLYTPKPNFHMAHKPKLHDGP